MEKHSKTPQASLMSETALTSQASLTPQTALRGNYEDFETITVINKGLFKTSFIRDPFSSKRYVKKELAKTTLPLYQALQNLKHQSLVEVIEIIEKNDKIIVILEYVIGETLKSILDTKIKLDERVAINYIQQLASILSVVHQNGIIHRDINPNNIIVTPNDQVKLIDFDIARFYKNDQIEDTQLLGTPGYAAPEQFGFNQSTASSDIYALGILLNVMVTGMKPNEMLIKNESLAIIVKNCIAMDQISRYQDVWQLDYDLRRVSYPVIYNHSKKAKKKRMSPIIAIILSLLFWAFIGFSWLVYLELQEDFNNQTQLPSDIQSENFEENLFLGTNFSMEIATGWAMLEFEGTDFLIAPNRISNINILYEPMRGRSFEAYVGATLHFLENSFTNLEVIIDDDIEINGKVARFLAYTSDMAGVHTTYQFFIEADGTAYIITYTRMDSGDYLDDVFKMVETFTVR